MPIIRLTKRTIDDIPLAAGGQILYRDADLRGFGLRVGTTRKVFFVEAQVATRTVRTTIGPYGPLMPDVARRLALQKLSLMAQGRNPNADQRSEARRRTTLAEAFEQFFAARPKLSPRTIDSYKRTIRLYLLDWAERPLREIKRSVVLARHRELAATKGGTTANAAMRHLRSVYNAAAAEDDELPLNPVAAMTQARAWRPERRRSGLITPAAFPAWWEAVMAEPALSRDILLVAVFTGMRRREIGGLRWSDIDFKAHTLEVAVTKNGDALKLPLSGFLAGLLARRKLLVGVSPFVFPTRSKSGHVEEMKSFTSRVGMRCGVQFSMHDLRRTFVTVAESLDTPSYTLKRLLNHRTSADVTGGYIIIDVDRLRGPVQSVAAKLLSLARPEVQAP